MNAESKELLIRNIKAGTRIEEPSIVIRKLLEEYKMGEYSRLFCNRIKQAGLIDGTHVMTMYGKTDEIHVDAEGLKAVKPILSGYVEPEILDGLETGLREYSGITTNLNNILYILRNQSRKELRRMQREAVQENEIDKDIYALELKQRSVWNRIRRFWEYSLEVFRAAIDVRIPLRAMPVYLKVVYPFMKAGAYDPRYSGGPYYKALMRFESRHGACKELKRDDLIKYVYLGVKAFGSEYFELKNEPRIKSMEKIEWIHKRCQDIMEAIGELAPAQLIQLFPVTKDFKGGEYGCKDYFWTMEKLAKLPRDKPIGTEQNVADVLWDYVNHDTEFFFLNWMNAIDDMSTYCGKNEPRENFYGRRIKASEAKTEGA